MKHPQRSSRVECELTIDDGPSVHTEPLLEALARLERRAVFFVVGQHIHEHPRQLDAIAEAGHEIGNHTFDHVALNELDEAGIRDQLIRCNEAIEAHGISTPTLFRPPYGRTSPTVVEVAEKLGMQQLLWHVTPEDWRPDAPPHETRRAIVGAGADAVVLLHERANTVEALRQLHR
jgi:peptidoglycan/xylan/chitin deacetylase (PgdA/CDA1 family)